MNGFLLFIFLIMWQNAKLRQVHKCSLFNVNQKLCFQQGAGCGYLSFLRLHVHFLSLLKKKTSFKISYGPRKICLWPQKPNFIMAPGQLLMAPRNYGPTKSKFAYGPKIPKTLMAPLAWGGEDTMCYPLFRHKSTFSSIFSRFYILSSFCLISWWWYFLLYIFFLT